MYNAKLSENTEADNINGILKIATIPVPLKYLSNFWRSLEMLLISRKVERKLKWTKYCVLSADGTDNINNTNFDNVIFTIKDKIIFSCGNFIRKRQPKTIKTS